MNFDNYLLKVVFMGLLIILGCSENNNPVDTYPDVNREDKLPSDITKRNPETDQHPPILHSTDFSEPIALPYPVNTSGTEDSPFILPDGKTLYFFFTPDVRVPPERQISDDVTGVWISQNNGTSWNTPERVWLQNPGKLALDGAVCVQDDEMWFASAREGYSGVNMFTAQWTNAKWIRWKYAGDRLMKEIQIGEVHLYQNDLYFHSDRPGGKGVLDIWVTTRNGSSWSDPVNLEAINSEFLDGYPFVSSDGNQLWFTRTYQGTPAIYRSFKVDGQWNSPVLIMSQFAGEPTLDEIGNLYFVHHFFEDGTMIEADIYVSYIN